MIDWDGKVGRHSFLCAVDGQRIGPGEDYYAALNRVEDGFALHDVRAGNWESYDRSATVSWWRQTIPERRDHAPTIDAAVLLEIFDDVAGTTDRLQQCFAYTLALLLVRLKKLRFIELHQEDGEAWLYLQRKGGAALRVRDPQMDASEQAYVEETIQELIAPQAAAIAESDPATDPATGTAAARP
jgi:hypothetical protein